MPDRRGVDTVVSALINHFDPHVGVDEGQRNLQSPRSPAPCHRHLAAGIGHLTTGHRPGFDHFAPHFALGRGVQKAVTHRLPGAGQGFEALWRHTHCAGSFEVDVFSAVLPVFLALRIASKED